MEWNTNHVASAAGNQYGTRGTLLLTNELLQCQERQRKRDSWKTSSTSPSCHYPSIPTTQMHGSPPHILPDDRPRPAREPRADGQPRHRQDALDDGIQHKRACLLATRNAAPLTSEIERWILPSVEPAATSEYVLMTQWFMITWLTFSWSNVAQKFVIKRLTFSLTFTIV